MVQSKFLILALSLLFVEVRSAFATNIKINEFYAAGTTNSNPDWVEVYSDEVDISSYQLMDTLNNKKDLAAATCDGNFCTINWYNYLNNSGDTIKLVLKTAIDSPIDQVTYPGDISIPSSGQSAARNPDVTGNWLISSSPTKGALNNPSTPSPTATLISSPTPTPSPTPTSTPTLSAVSSTSSFTIANIPSQINSDQSFNVSVDLILPNNKNTDYYLSGAFKKVGNTRYFGLTKISSDWVKYDGNNYLNQYKITTNDSGNWTGILEVKLDTADSDYKGAGDYIFKVARYSSSSNPTWSNETTIKITGISNSSQGSVTPPPSTTPTPSQSYSKNQMVSANKPKNDEKLVYRIASVAAVTTSATPSSKVEIKSQKQTNYLVWTGIILVFAGISSIGYIYLRKNANIRIKLRRRN